MHAERQVYRVHKMIFALSVKFFEQSTFLRKGESESLADCLWGEIPCCVGLLKRRKQLKSARELLHAQDLGIILRGGGFLVRDYPLKSRLLSVDS